MAGLALRFAAPGRSRCVGECGERAVALEAVGPVAELAGRRHRALLGENGLDLGPAEQPQCAADALGRARTAEAQLAGLEHPDVVLDEQAPQQVRVGELDELVRPHGAAQYGETVPVVTVAVPREALEQQAACVRVAGMEEQAARQLLRRRQVMLEQRGDRARIDRVHFCYDDEARQEPDTCSSQADSGAQGVWLGLPGHIHALAGPPA